MRTVRVKALGDPTLIREDPRWRETVTELIEAASDYFEEEFGIRFIVAKVTPWPIRGGIFSTRKLIKSLQESVPLTDRDGRYDLIIGFSGGNVDIYGSGMARVNRLGNCQSGLANYMVSSVSSLSGSPEADSATAWDVLVLVHEFGHVFGAEHTDDSSSIMYRDFAFRTDFDRKNRAVILKNRGCPFGKR